MLKCLYHDVYLLYTGLDQTGKYEEKAWRRRVISAASCEEEKVESVAVFSKNIF